ncbi:MAG: murein L,D-transpeptidase catalytic domain family protein [Sneathiellaceae bacterium]
MLPLIVALALTLTLTLAPIPAGAQPAVFPDWLQPHVGTGEGQIAPIVLARARALYQEKQRQGIVRNPCYLAMDATRPSAARDGQPGRRFYVICEAARTFRAESAGHGSGRKLPGADSSNERQCARNFSNAEGSNLTMGGAYMTAETRTSFKGYYGDSGQTRAFHRTFLLFDGEGETRNARERAIGGHPAMFVRWRCRLRSPDSPHADPDGFVPFGHLVNYTGGRSNGCTTWSGSASQDIISLVEGDPTSLYIYPESRDIDAIAGAVRSGIAPSDAGLSEAGLYWNSACLAAIGAPKFWPKRTLQPVIDRWRQSLPERPPLVLPICQ